MTRITYRFTRLSDRSTVYRSLRKYLVPENLSRVQRGDPVLAEIWSSPKGFLVRLSFGKSPILLYGASPTERVGYGYGSGQAEVGVHGFGEGIFLPVLSDEIASSPLYLDEKPGVKPGPGEACRIAGCHPLFLRGQDGASLRLTRSTDDRIAFDYWDVHGSYQKSLTGGTAVWAYEERNARDPSQGVRVTVERVETVGGSTVPDWQRLLPAGTHLMTSDGKAGYALDSPNGTDPSVRFEKQQRFWGFHDALASRNSRFYALLGGLVAIATVVLGITAALRRRARRSSVT